MTTLPPVAPPVARLVAPLVALVLAAAVTGTSAAAATTAATRDGYRGHDRLLVVFAPDRASPPLRAQRRDVAAATAAFAERDLRVVEVVGGTVHGSNDTAAALRVRFGVAPAAFRALLVGRDGHVALDAAAPLATPKLVAAIDAMPMRRVEMARTGRAAPSRR